MTTDHLAPSPPLARACLAALLLSACAGPRGAAPSSASDTSAAAEAARLADRAMGDAVAARDAAAFGRIVAEDALFLGARGPADGRAAVVAAWAPYLAAGGPTLAWAPDRAEAAASGDVAFTWGPWTWRGPDGAAATGRYLTAWRRDADGAWRAVLDGDAAPLPRLPAGVTREVLRSLRSADGRLGAEAGLLREGGREAGQFLTLWRMEDGRRRVLDDAGRLR